MRSLMRNTFSSSATSAKHNESSSAPQPVVSTPHVAVIGGGLAGLSAASCLTKLKIPTTVFDMGTRVPGGRACSRILTEDGKKLSFDHGAQFLAPQRGGKFEKEVKEWVAAGVAAPWHGKFGILDASTSKFTPHDSTDNNTSDIITSNNGFCGILSSSNSDAARGRDSGSIYVGVPHQGAIAQHLATTIKTSSSTTATSSSTVPYPKKENLVSGTSIIGDGVHPNESKVKIGHKVTGLFYNKTEKLWTVEGVPRSASATTPASFGKFNAIIVADALVVLPESAGYAGAGLREGEGNEEIREIVRQIQSVRHQPVFSLLVAFEENGKKKEEIESGGNDGSEKGREDLEFFEEENVPFDGATVISSDSSNSSFQWIAKNSSKPGRTVGKESTWVAITTPERAKELLKTWPLHTTKGAYNPQTHEYRDAVAKELLGEFLETLEKAAKTTATTTSGAAAMGNAYDSKSKRDLRSRVVYYHAQRWGRGFVENPLKMDYLGSQTALFAACGDFCSGSGEGEAVLSPVEAAWLSGQNAAEAVASWLGSDNS